MDIKILLTKLPEETLQQIPAPVYGIQKAPTPQLKVVNNDINRTSQYLCAPYYKPITQIVDLEKLKIKRGEKD